MTDDVEYYLENKIYYGQIRDYLLISRRHEEIFWLHFYISAQLRSSPIAILAIYQQ